MIFAWQGWQLEIPDHWSPVRLEGTFDAGYALLSEIDRPGVGLRWSTPERRSDSRLWARKVLVAEVGQLAADEAQWSEGGCYCDGLLYREMDPPGRDVLAATSPFSGRTFECVHHVYADEPSRLSELQHGLIDTPEDREMSWSVFDLSCRTPAGWRLETHCLNAGDLSLTFVRGSEGLKLRQIAIAHLALKRMPMERWLEEAMWVKNRARAGANAPLKIELPDGRILEGISRPLKVRSPGLWRTAVNVTQVALHDAARDRLVFIEGKDLAAVEKLARSIGWAASKASVHEVAC